MLFNRYTYTTSDSGAHWQEVANALNPATRRPAERGECRRCGDVVGTHRTPTTALALGMEATP